MSLAYVSELIFVLGMGMGLSRVWNDHLRSVPDPYVPFWIVGARDDLFTPVAVFLGVVGTVGAICLLVESVMGRSPKHWGVGRWTWSVVGVFGILVTFRGLLTLYPSRNLQASALQAYFANAWGSLAPLLLALLITARFGRVPSVVPDGREWAGRLFGLSILAISVLQVGLEWWLVLID